MYYDVVEAKPVGDLELAICFADGTKGLVRFAASHLHGVFASLNDPNIFRQVACREGFVSWPGEVDLAPDAMYAANKRDGEWVLV